MNADYNDHVKIEWPREISISAHTKLSPRHFCGHQVVRSTDILVVFVLSTFSYSLIFSFASAISMSKIMVSGCVFVMHPLVLWHF